MDTQLEQLTDKLVDFSDKRDWGQFHTPKNLAMSLGIEAAELMECFQWKNDEEIKEYIDSDEKIKLQEEIADVASYLLLLCHETGIDLYAALNDKIEKNNKKYPVELSRGNARKYTEL